MSDISVEVRAGIVDMVGRYIQQQVKDQLLDYYGNPFHIDSGPLNDPAKRREIALTAMQTMAGVTIEVKD